ncbi:MAG: hypothetical protein ACI9WU_003542 [Myxococcota bacterium]|jgi:hypothetical protein
MIGVTTEPPTEKTGSGDTGSGDTGSGDTGTDGDCLAIPVCDEGHDEVDGPSGCLQDDAVCYEATECGVTIWCTGPDAPDPAPTSWISGGGPAGDIDPGRRRCGG